MGKPPFSYKEKPQAMPVEKGKAEALKWKEESPFAKVEKVVPTTYESKGGLSDV